VSDRGFARPSTTRLLLVEHLPDLTAATLRRHFERVGAPASITVAWPADLLARSPSEAADVLVISLQAHAGVDGLSVADRLWTRDRIYTVFVAATCDAEVIGRAVVSGGRGWLVTPASSQQWVSSVLLAAAHHQLRGPAEPARSLKDVGGPHQLLAAALSPRERRVVGELLNNQRVTQIAVRLGISPNTVRNHLKAIYRKCGVRSQLELIAAFLEHE